MLAAVSSAFWEVSDTIGKKTVQSRLESYYTFGFLNLFFGSVFLGLYVIALYLHCISSFLQLSKRARIRCLLYDTLCAFFNLHQAVCWAWWHHSPMRSRPPL
jgi:hypothetical protein